MIRTYVFLASTEPRDPFGFVGDAAAQRFSELCPEAVGYVQTRALEEQLDGVPTPPWSGIGELWFIDAADALARASRPETLAPLWASRDVSVVGSLTGHERVVMRLPRYHQGGFIKGVFPFRRKAGLTVSEFQRTWWHDHGPIAAQTEAAVCYVQCHPLAAGYQDAGPPHDGITELYWPDLAAARAAMSSRQMREDQATDAERFVEPGTVGLLMAVEEHVLQP